MGGGISIRRSDSTADKEGVTYTIQFAEDSRFKDKLIGDEQSNAQINVNKTFATLAYNLRSPPSESFLTRFANELTIRVIIGIAIEYRDDGVTGGVGGFITDPTMQAWLIKNPIVLTRLVFLDDICVIDLTGVKFEYNSVDGVAQLLDTLSKVALTRRDVLFQIKYKFLKRPVINDPQKINLLNGFNKKNLLLRAEAMEEGTL